MASVAQPVARTFRMQAAGSTLTGVAGLASPAGGADEAGLARRAAAGDGDAFAELYERYEGRAYNLCYRILGSPDDAADATQEAFVNVLRRLPNLEGRDLVFGSYLFTSARNACYDLIDRRKRAQPSDEIAESATPVGGGVGGGGTGFEPGDPEDDPERNVLLEARTEEIRNANSALPERQREALALKELEELSYDEIAEIMDMNRNSVAQLISRARINLRDALRGTALASIAVSSPECERALPLIAAQQDGQLGDRSGDAAWLGDHLASCDTCRLGREAMEEAGVSYRAWLPIAAGPVLFRETMAEAAELVGADWSETIARHEARRAGGAGAAAGAAGPGAEGARAAVLRHRRLDIALMGLLACLLLLVVMVGVASDGEPPPAVAPAAEEEPAPAAADETDPEPGKPDREKPKKDGDQPAPPAATGPDTEAEEPDEPADGRDPVVASPDAEPAPRRTQKRDRAQGRDDSGGEGGVTPGLTPDPPPPPPQPPDTTPEDPTPDPPSSDPGCRDANGLPVPCPPPRPPTCTPSDPNCRPGGLVPPPRP
jgi:RNA polymerase sigma factor (sigma-70 family)